MLYILCVVNNIQITKCNKTNETFLLSLPAVFDLKLSYNGNNVTTWKVILHYHNNETKSTNISNITCSTLMIKTSMTNIFAKFVSQAYHWKTSINRQSMRGPGPHMGELANSSLHNQLLSCPVQSLRSCIITSSHDRLRGLCIRSAEEAQQYKVSIERRITRQRKITITQAAINKR